MQSALSKTKSVFYAIKAPHRTYLNTLQEEHSALQMSFDARTKRAEGLLKQLREQRALLGDGAVPDLRLTADFLTELREQVDRCANEI